MVLGEQIQTTSEALRDYAYKYHVILNLRSRVLYLVHRSVHVVVGNRQQPINQEFDVQFHPVYLRQFLKNLGLSRAIPRTKRPSKPENADEILDERVGDAFDENDDEPHNKREGDDEEGWVVDDDICTDGGTVFGFFDTSHPQP